MRSQASPRLPVRRTESTDPPELRGRIVRRKARALGSHVVEEGDHDSVVNQNALKLGHRNQAWRLALRARERKCVPGTLANVHPGRLHSDRSPANMARGYTDGDQQVVEIL